MTIAPPINPSTLITSEPPDYDLNTLFKMRKAIIIPRLKEDLCSMLSKYNMPIRFIISRSKNMKLFYPTRNINDGIKFRKNSKDNSNFSNLDMKKSLYLRFYEFS